MELDSSQFPVQFLWISAIPTLLGLWYALRLAPWRRLLDREQLHVFLGSCVALMVMWSLRTDIHAGLQFHLLFLTTLTLMFGWSLGVLGGLLVLLGVTLAGLADWYAFGLNFISVVLLPVTLTQVLLVLIRHWCPKHFFIYIYLNAFLSGGVAIVLSSLLSSLFLVMAGVEKFSTLWDTYLSFFPLMFFPEAVLNGWFMTLLVGYRPHWVGSFRDEEYLQDK
ncbi:MAG: energy-coupling factor ABC transporter permease [Chromatiales bacterium]|jgi:uncharacterized membrane protein